MANIQQYLTQEIGNVQNVDTQKVIVNVKKEELLNKLKINDLAILSGNNADEKLRKVLILMVLKLMRIPYWSILIIFVV